MAANLETMFYTREKPWHGLGVRVEKALTSEDALRLAVAYSVGEAAEAIGVSRTFLYTYLGEHPEFPQMRLGTRIIIPKKRLEEYVNS